MRLPVIQTCGECGYCYRTHDPGHVGDICAHPSADAQEWMASSEPPPWCPLRTGADAERIAALEAVASAAEEAASWVLSTDEGGSFPQLGRALASLRPLLRRLRRLT